MGEQVPFSAEAFAALAASPAVSQTCELPQRGIAVSYAVVGAQGPSATDALLIPGLGCNRFLALGLHPVCEKNSVRLFCVDRPGYGGTSPYNNSPCDSTPSKGASTSRSTGHSSGWGSTAPAAGVPQGRGGLYSDTREGAVNSVTLSEADGILEFWAGALEEFVRLKGLKRVAVITLSCGALYGLAFLNRLNQRQHPQQQQQQQGTLPQKQQQAQGSRAPVGGSGGRIRVLEPMLMLAPFLAKDMPPTLQVLEQGPRSFLASAASTLMTASMGMNGPVLNLVSRVGALSALSGLSTAATWGAPVNYLDAAILKMLEVEGKTTVPPSQRGSALDIKVCLGKPQLDWGACPIRLAALVGSKNWVTSLSTVQQYMKAADCTVIYGAGHNLGAEHVSLIYKKIEAVVAEYKLQ